MSTGFHTEGGRGEGGLFCVCGEGLGTRLGKGVEC